MGRQGRPARDFSRRGFLGSTASAVIAAGTVAKGRVFGAGDRIGVACVGLNGRGREHLRAFVRQTGAQVVALCDVDRKVLEGAGLMMRGLGASPKTYVDMREMLQDPAIDAVSFATPNHWHALGSLWAMQAGKHVYVEKPMAHNVWESRQVVKAAALYGRVLMHGTQRRSEESWLRMIHHLRSGVIGDLYMARALCYKRRNSIGFQPFSEPPAHLDWDLWQGPAEAGQYCENYVHYNWHWFWRYGNGDIGNQGVHQMDVAVWGMDKGLPVRVACMGGRYTYNDQGETPNTQVATFTYKDGTMLVFEVRGRWTNAEGGTEVGNLFYGSEGYFAEADSEEDKGKQMRFYDKSGKHIDVPEVPVETRGPFGNFIAAIRSGKAADNFAPPEAAHVGTVHCHLANIAYRTGRTLAFDPGAERFVGDDEANALLTRAYRAPFVVTEVA